jgi:hypothetical protein
MPIRVRMKVTVPDEVFNTPEMVERIVKAQRAKTEPDLTKLFQKTVEGWKTPPKWNHKQTTTSSSISMEVYPYGKNYDQYALVNTGARPHSIVPRTAPRLRFQRGYRAATRPRSLSSRSLMRFGEFSQTRHVSHPGFEGREFDATIADFYFDTFAEDMQEAIRDPSAK